MTEWLYKPSEWGKTFHSLPHHEALGAGSAGPGKTEVLLHEADSQIHIEHERCANKKHPFHIRWGESKAWVLHMRRTFPMLQQSILRAGRLFKHMDPGVKWDDDNNTFIFSSGLRYQFGHCKDPNSHEIYFSGEYTALLLDELVQFLEEQYDMLKSRVRTTDPVLITMLKVRAMSNPTLRRLKGEDFTVNDPHWVRRYFVDPAPQGRVTLKRAITRRDGSVENRTRIYLPATLYDNPNPDFVRQYEIELMSAKPHIRAALLYGDWYMQAGSFYADYWNPRLHVCKPFNIPGDWKRWRSMDWGFKKPGCIHWWAMDPEGNVYCEYELTFKGKLDSWVAERVKQIEIDLGLWNKREDKSKITGPADTQLWEQRGDSAKTKAQTFEASGVPWVQADKSSGSRRDHAQLLIGRLEDHDNGTAQPGIVFFSTCREAIKTIPAIPEDPGDSETPLDGGEDHWHDSVCYSVAYASHGLPGLKAPSEEEEDDFPKDAERDRPARGRHGYGSSLC